MRLIIGSGFDNIFQISRAKERMAMPQNAIFAGEPKGKTPLVVVAINRLVENVKMQAAPNQSTDV